MVSKSFTLLHHFGLVYYTWHMVTWCCEIMPVTCLCHVKVCLRVLRAIPRRKACMCKRSVLVVSRIIGGDSPAWCHMVASTNLHTVWTNLRRGCGCFVSSRVFMKTVSL